MHANPDCQIIRRTCTQKSICSRPITFHHPPRNDHEGSSTANVAPRAWVPNKWCDQLLLESLTMKHTHDMDITGYTRNIKNIKTNIIYAVIVSPDFPWFSQLQHRHNMSQACNNHRVLPSSGSCGSWLLWSLNLKDCYQARWPLSPSC